MFRLISTAVTANPVYTTHRTPGPKAAMTVEELCEEDSWHIEIFKRFCRPAHTSLPLLFDEQMALDLAPFRAFRHVVYHSYGF